jgi:hypothetical protein
MDIEIRSATPADVDTMGRVAERSWHAAHAPIVGTEVVERFLDEHYDTEAFRSLIDDETVLLDLAATDRPAVGFVVASPSEGSRRRSISAGSTSIRTGGRRGSGDDCSNTWNE